MDEPQRKGDQRDGPPDLDGPETTITERAATAESPHATVKLVRTRRRRRNARRTVETPLDAKLAETLDARPPAPIDNAPRVNLNLLRDRPRLDEKPAEIDDPPPSLPIVDPRAWDRYEIIRLLGKGGMGAVYEARDKRLDRRVAIKFLHSEDSLTTKRFLQEARAQARIDHPNVCRVLEVGEVQGRAYIAMQLIQGVSLTEAARSMTLDQKVRLMKTVTEAVHAAHRLGVIHRDIKPTNIMVEQIADGEGEPSQRPILMDFGLAREASDTKGLTESGAIMGTPSYMPPEQARGHTRNFDARGDVYSLGATLYDLLAGVPPFVDESAVNVILKVLIQDPVPLRDKDPSIPESLEIIVGKCLNKEPHQRYATAAELADDLERFLGRKRVLARRLSLPTRLYWRGKRNKPMAFAVVALVLSLIAFAGYGIRTVIVNARNEAIAQKRAELGQELGQAVKDLDWLVRSAYLTPLHDTGPEEAVVRARMAEIEREMRSYGDIAAGLDHYAVGRGHLALQEWEQARAHLEEAEARGVREPELDYALGRVLGEMYSRALEDARRSGDKGYFEKRKQEIERELLDPALGHLTRCRGVETIPASYLEGLIHFYQKQYDEALASAGAARGKLPWLYEAEKLEGDVFMTQALDEKDRGENAQAERDFGQAVAHYEQAVDIGRSDHRLYEALAEAWIRQEEMDLYQGRDPAPKLAQALAAAAKALIAAPKESDGYTKRAFAYHFQARYAEGHGVPQEEIERLRQAQIAAGQAAIASHPDDAYAHEITGLAYTRLANYLLDRGKPVDSLLERARAHLEDAIRTNPKFPWAYNDFGFALALTAISQQRRDEDPVDSFRRAIEATQEAIRIDDRYLIAYNNTSLWLTLLAEWRAKHGMDPEDTLRDAVQMADKALRLNASHPPAYGNAGLALARIASYRLETGADGREPARQAIDRFKALLAIDPKDVQAQLELSRAYHLLARHERALGVDPRASLDKALHALEQCARIEPGNAACQSEEATVHADDAEWAKQRDNARRDMRGRSRSGGP